MINSIQSVETTDVAMPPAVKNPKLKDNLARKESKSPSLKSLQPRQSLKTLPDDAKMLDAHSDLRAKSRSLVQVNAEAVKEVLGSHAAILDRIHPSRLENFYKHGSMMLNAPVSDKVFLVNCLALLYVTSPDANHPNAVDPAWLDDQEVLWGDELMFLFENSRDLDTLNETGKIYFADSLLSREGIARQDMGIETALKQTLFQSKQRL